MGIGLIRSLKPKVKLFSVFLTILMYQNTSFDYVSLAGKKKEDIENFINEGVYQIEKLKADGWITDIKYDDEVYT